MRDAIPQAEICYGVKASTEPGLLKLLAESGRCFDGASPSEIDLCPAVEQQMPTAGRPKGLRLPADRRQAAHGIADRAIFGDPHHHLGRPPPTSRMGVPVRAGVPGGGGEGTGGYGAGLCRFLLAQRIEVIDVNRPTVRPAAGTGSRTRWMHRRRRGRC
ncbi:hypothetical protein ACFYXD_15595 [Streptomyces platensis]|uniref:hypothetical protein n=1 Tax=Streptomyces platensis TaxID=58346 RepID=UPI003689BAFB